MCIHITSLRVAVCEDPGALFKPGYVRVWAGGGNAMDGSVRIRSISISTSIFIFISISVHVYTYVYVDVYIYIQTHLHLYCRVCRALLSVDMGL